MNRAGTVLAATGAALAMVLALGGCATTPAVVARDNPDVRLVGQWVLVRASDPHGTISLQGTYVTLTIDEGRDAYGLGPCNGYTARVVGRPGAVFITVRTLAGLCTDTVATALNDRYVRALAASSIASIEANRMTLASSTTSLTFQRVPHFMIGGI